VTEEEVRLLESYLYEIGPLDPRVFVAGLALGLILVLSASWLPARRAAKVDPVVALRSV
jgi:ABC-type lipoprotein release transport system permease subunit